jgi:hypothetical protein
VLLTGKPACTFSEALSLCGVALLIGKPVPTFPEALGLIFFHHRGVL